MTSGQTSALALKVDLLESEEAIVAAEKMYEAKMSSLTDDEAESQRKVQEQIAADILGGV